MQYCKLIGKNCPHAAHSFYDPIYEQKGERENTFCGMITGYDCRINELPKCWLDMTNTQKSAHKKKMRIKYETYRFSK